MEVKIEPKEEPVNGQTEAHADQELAVHGVKREAGADDGSEAKRVKVEESADGSPDDLQKRIIRQVEYYFGDFNLPKDKFLREQISQNDGWVSMDIMLKFARLSVLSQNPLFITTALKLSTSGLLEVSPDGQKIRRTSPIQEETEETRKEWKARSVYCKGFPKGSTFDNIWDYLTTNHPSVVNLQMRHFNRSDGTRQFKGTANITFATRQQAEEFISLETVKFNDYALARMWMTEWEAEKAKESADWKERMERKKAGNQNGEKKEANDKENGDKGKEESRITLPRGTMIKLTNLPSSANIHQIKTALSAHTEEVAFVELSTENTAVVRLRKENEAKVVFGKLDGKIAIGDALADVTIIEGEEEEELVKKAEQRLNTGDFRSGGRGAWRGGRGRGRGNRRGGRRGGRNRDD